MGQRIHFSSPDGGDAYLAVGQAPRPPVLLLHAWWGLNQPVRDLADRLAGDGFTVLAPDLFDGTVNTTVEDAEAFTTSIERGSGGPGGLTPDRIMGRVRAALDHLLSLPDVSGNRAAIIALSFGGWYGSQVAAERSDIAAFVSIYSDVYEGPGGAAYLGHFAENDEFVDSPTATGDGSTHVYPGMKHWFMESDRPEYDEGASDLAYGRTVEFLRAAFA